MDKFLHAVGWKRDDRWDKYEVAVDIAICSTTMLGICLLTSFMG